MSAKAPMTALHGVTTDNGVSVVAPESGPSEPVAGRVLPTRAELATVLPWPGLRHGSTVHESPALLWALLSEVTGHGSWAAVVGLPGLALTAASETGGLAERALVPQPGSDPVRVAAARRRTRRMLLPEGAGSTDPSPESEHVERRGLRSVAA